MEKDQPVSVKDAVFKLQLSMLEGIQNEDHLFAAGSLMSRSDYEDVVTERSITNICGYPLCRNPLPSDRPQKGRYRISLKEHKVYDLHETYMYCSPSCVVNSKAFSGSLPDKRSSALDPQKLNEIFRLFGNMSLGTEENSVNDEDLGLSDLKIQEKRETSTGEVALEEWIGPSNAIEGYVPKQRDNDSKGLSRKNLKKGSKAGHSKLGGDKNLIINEMDFISTVITQDGYSVSKLSSSQTERTSDHKMKPTTEVKSAPFKMDSEGISRKDDPGIQDLSSAFESNLNLSTSETDKEPASIKETKSESASSSNLNTAQCVTISEKQSEVERSVSEKESTQLWKENSIITANNSTSPSNLNAANAILESHIEKMIKNSKPKSSLKSKGEKKLSRSVTWADEKSNSSGSKSLCEVREMKDIKIEPEMVDNIDVEDDEVTLCHASAEACALALSQASEAVASGKFDVNDAVYDSGLIILPPPHDAGEDERVEDVDVLEPESVTLKWPRKSGISSADFFDSEDSWYDDPPEGFSLTLSPFATMWNALFSWITSSSLAYIYGRDESFHEEYLSVNGREYPLKTILADGRSSEIKQTLASCLARALPGLVADLRLPTPVSTLEQGMARLLDTMTFMDALPAFRMRQWQVVVLLFIDALSVSRIPGLISYMVDRRMLFHKVLEGTEIGMEEYEVLKDLIIPLGRAPHFSAQSGA